MANNWNFIAATKEFNTLEKSVPAPYLRKSFAVNCDCIGKLKIAACGFYELYFNGEKINESFIKNIGDEWMLITAGNKDKYNMMTASWGSMGIMWNKNIVNIVESVGGIQTLNHLINTMFFQLYLIFVILKIDLELKI